jgi:hypothetical protein
MVDSSSKCDKSEEAGAQTFLFRRKPHLPMAYGFASKQKCLSLCKLLWLRILFCRTSNVKLNIVSSAFSNHVWNCRPPFAAQPPLGTRGGITAQMVSRGVLARSVAQARCVTAHACGSPSASKRPLCQHPKTNRHLCSKNCSEKLCFSCASLSMPNDQKLNHAVRDSRQPERRECVIKCQLSY